MLKVTPKLGLGKWRAKPKCLTNRQQIELHTAYSESTLCNLNWALCLHLPHTHTHTKLNLLWALCACILITCMCVSKCWASFGQRMTHQCLIMTGCRWERTRWYQCNTWFWISQLLHYLFSPKPYLQRNNRGNTASDIHFCSPRYSFFVCFFK